MDPNTEVLNLKGTPIPVIDNTSFIRYLNLTDLIMPGCSLVHVQNGTFNWLWKIKHINMMFNKIIEFPDNFGMASKSITHLNFWCAFKLQTLPPFYFRNFTNLSWVNVGCNKWKPFDPSILPGSLTSINLNYMYRTYVFPNFTRWTPNLNGITIRGVRMRELPAENIRNMNFTKIVVAENQLSTIPERAAYPYIEIFKLHKNRLASLPDLFNTRLKQISLSENPLRCDQALCWLLMWPWMSDTNILTDSPICASPDTETGKPLMEVRPISMKCYNGMITSSIDTRKFLFILQYTYII